MNIKNRGFWSYVFSVRRKESHSKSDIDRRSQRSLWPLTEETASRKQEETVPEWEYKKRARRGRVSRTGDERQILCLILVFGTALTGFAAGLGKKKK